MYLPPVVRRDGRLDCGNMDTWAVGSASLDQPGFTVVTLWGRGKHHRRILSTLYVSQDVMETRGYGPMVQEALRNCLQQEKLDRKDWVYAEAIVMKVLDAYREDHYGMAPA